MNWDRYTLLVALVANGPHNTECDDALAQDGKRTVREVNVELYVDLFCKRCDTEIAALEPDDVEIDDVLSVICAHEVTCVPALSWEHA